MGEKKKVLISLREWPKKRRISNESKKTFTYGNCRIINILCRNAGVEGVKNDLKLKKAANMDEKWLEKLIGVPLAPPKVPRNSPLRKEREIVDGTQTKYDNLTLRLANAVVDMRKALN